MKKNLIILFVLLGVAVSSYYLISNRNKELTASTFPKQVQGYVRQDLKGDDSTNQASGVFLGVKKNINKSFMATYKAPGAVATLWVVVPQDKSQELTIAQELAQNMTKQGTLFSDFNTITVKDKPVVTFSGPMDKMRNYIFFKDGKVFWLEVLTKGNPEQAFDAFYNEF